MTETNQWNRPKECTGSAQLSQEHNEAVYDYIVTKLFTMHEEDLEESRPAVVDEV